MKKVLYVIVAIAFLGCDEAKKNFPTEFDYGTIENGVYINTFFEMAIKYNPDWAVKSRQELDQLIDEGSEMVSGDDRQLKAVVKASKVNTANLMSVFKYEMGTTLDFNPSFMVVAENIKNFPQIKNGEDYLINSKKLLERSPMAYYFEKDIYNYKIKSLDCYVMEAKLDVLDYTVIQEYITGVKNGFTLSFIISYATEDQRQELYEIVDNIQI